jgi:D-beta-D-heptose 7-phosphate kinase/D-beta-D-heptose 1-phosphate adenosyltransferase
MALSNLQIKKKQMIFTRDEIIEKAKEWHEESKTIVFTNGCFDLLHQGHIDLLNKAGTFGDILIVGLNSDRSVKKLKGENRPIEPEIIRAQTLDSQNNVSGVCIFDDETPHSLILDLHPKILVKGGDYHPNEVVGGSEVIQWGGRVEIVSLTPGFSTTEMVQKIRREGLV